MLRNLVSAATIAIAAFTAEAAPLAPGGAISPVPLDSVAARPELGGAVINDNLLDFRFNFGDLTDVLGQVQNRVTRSNDLATLIFSPRIRDVLNIYGGRFAITRFNLTGYAGFDADIAFRPDGDGDNAPWTAARSADGDTLRFSFASPLLIDSLDPPGLQEESLFPAILTNAQAFDETGRMSIWGRFARGDVLTDPEYRIDLGYVARPVDAPVPLPAGALLLPAGLALMGLLRRRR